MLISKGSRDFWTPFSKFSEAATMPTPPLPQPLRLLSHYHHHSITTTITYRHHHSYYYHDHHHQYCQYQSRPRAKIQDGAALDSWKFTYVRCLSYFGSPYSSSTKKSSIFNLRFRFPKNIRASSDPPTTSISPQSVTVSYNHPPLLPRWLHQRSPSYHQHHHE